MVFASSSIGQYAALAALEKKPTELTQKYRFKRDIALTTLKNSFPQIYGAEGAFYIFLPLPAGVLDVKFVNQVAHQGVIILPGSAFSQHNSYVRIAFGAESDNLKIGLKRLCRSIKVMHV